MSSKLKKIPWIPIILLLLTYSIFGYIFAKSIPDWVTWWLENKDLFNLNLTESFIIFSIKLFGFILIVFTSFVFTSPLVILNFLFGSWLKSDTKALLSILVSAFGAVLIFCWLDQFVRILILIAAAMLLRFELQRAGYSKSFRRSLLISLTSFAFYIGLII